MQHPSSYKDKQVVVLGLARSGVSVAKLFHKYGAKVVVNDKKEREQSPEAAELEVLGIPVICGYHPDDLVTEETSLLVKNPGIPYTAPPIVRAIQLHIDVITEVEVAYWLSEAPIIGITGSNGKTTTTTVIGKLLEAANLNPIVGGNIGLPLCEIAEQVTDKNWIVAELSSFQLKGTQTFRPKIALLLNLAETHLDYHGGMEDYVASKAKIFANQTADDVVIYNADYPSVAEIGKQAKGRKFPFSIYQTLEQGVYVSPAFIENVEDDEIVTRHIVYKANPTAAEVKIMPVDELGIPGRHNVANAIAAIAAALMAGADTKALVEPLQSFRGVEHRLEFVRDLNGVAYYNDSKATNGIATTMTIRSLHRPIVLIAGGLDRGSDYMDLLEIFKDKVKAVVAIGETRHKIAHIATLAGLSHIEIVEHSSSTEATLQEAVKKASSLASEGDIVLLSPACASWDMFKTFEQRGSMFKQSVHTL